MRNGMRRRLDVRAGILVAKPTQETVALRRRGRGVGRRPQALERAHGDRELAVVIAAGSALDEVLVETGTGRLGDAAFERLSHEIDRGETGHGFLSFPERDVRAGAAADWGREPSSTYASRARRMPARPRCNSTRTLVSSSPRMLHVSSPESPSTSRSRTQRRWFSGDSSNAARTTSS